MITKQQQRANINLVSKIRYQQQMDPRTINFTWNVELMENYDKYLCATMADV